jgi:integrase
MKQFDPENERILHRYFEYMGEALQRTEGTIEEARKCIHKYQLHTGFANFKTFGKDDAISFKRALRTTKTKRTGEPLSISTLEYTVRNVKDFFIWLSQQPGYRSRIKPLDAEYFNLSENEKRAAKAKGRRKYPSREQVISTLEHMPATTDAEIRDRAVLAFLLLSGVRVEALRTLRMKHVSPERMEITQNPREVATKFRKHVVTFYYPVGNVPLDIFNDYYRMLKEDRLFGPDDPLFPTIQHGVTADKRVLSKQPWSSGQGALKAVKAAFQSVGMEAYPAHSIRHTLAAYGEEVCKTPAEWKAWSQNLGHDDTRTTFDCYGYMDHSTQEKNIKKFWEPVETDNDGSKDGQATIDELHCMMKKMMEEREVKE